MLIAAALLAVSSPAAVTPDAPDRRVATVSADGLDLSHPAGVAQFTRRVRWAVARVCDISGRTLEEVTWQRRCMAEAVASAEPQVRQLLVMRGAPDRRLASR